MAKHSVYAASKVFGEEKFHVVLLFLSSRVKGYLVDYEKSADVFGQIEPYQADAIKRAKVRAEEAGADFATVICRDSNPVTTVYELVDYLNSQRI